MLDDLLLPRQLLLLQLVLQPQVVVMLLGLGALQA